MKWYVACFVDFTEVSCSWIGALSIVRCKNTPKVLGALGLPVKVPSLKSIPFNIRICISTCGISVRIKNDLVLALPAWLMYYVQGTTNDTPADNCQVPTNRILYAISRNT